MIAEEPNAANLAEEGLSGAGTQARDSLSLVRGFQVVAAEDDVAAQKRGGDDAWRDALRLELELRAQRFHQAVDEAIVLSNEGLIRWLGDPVARLAPGPNVLTPTAVVLADEALPAASQEIVKNRIGLWLGSTTRRVLGPLFALEELQEGSEAVRDLARKLSHSFGILERAPIRKQVNALAQGERAELRKHGVRFGAYYVFVPALIKPAPRTLALQLWSLRASGEPQALMSLLSPLASSGRTSLPFDGAISREGYRLAGYRPSGERIVRIDVVERLADMIRAANAEGLAGPAPGRSGDRTANGFIVSGQMTSLTGCSGDQFASILRSMGFESAEMTRSEFFGSSSAIEPAQKCGPAKPAEDASVAVDDQPAAPGPGENEAPTEADLMSPSASHADRMPAEVASPTEPCDVSRADGSEAESVAESPAPEEKSKTGVGSAKNADVIVVWRRNLLHHGRSGRKPEINRVDPAGTGPHATGRDNVEPRSVKLSSSAAAKRAGNTNQQSDLSSPFAMEDARAAARRRPRRANEPGAAHSHEQHRQSAVNRDMPQSQTAVRQQSRAKVDPDSPFAKLLELRSLLEGQPKQRP
jgi:ATP-dependent RNA helicase SUPV3L1/SUV3